jgi:hypothetical protein
MMQVIDRMGMAGVGICYGMTETSPVSTQTRADDSLERRVSTVGRVAPHQEIKIVDPRTGLVVPRGVPGELCTRGYSIMLGYWNQPEVTAEAIDPARWMHTGDLAVMDGDGYLTITGRIKDMVIRGGENVYPREVEEFLYTHPDILDAQVIGIPDATYGEELMAWIKMRPGAEPLTAQQVREFATGKLAHYKIPRYVHVTDEFPMTVTGKVRKVEMREISVEILGLDARPLHARPNRPQRARAGTRLCCQHVHGSDGWQRATAGRSRTAPGRTRSGRWRNGGGTGLSRTGWLSAGWSSSMTRRPRPMSLPGCSTSITRAPPSTAA